jgi:regulator of sigma E protease
MSSTAYALLAILGLAVLMVVHEGGHYLVARWQGMRVTRFSIGFGPTLWKHKPKGSPTTFQIAIIPFLAYVQIAGMNPFDDDEPNDTGSYANASLWARIVTIAAGPLANYFFASVLMFCGFFLGGNLVIDETMRVNVEASGPAAEAGMVNGDRIRSVNGEAIDNWEELQSAVSAHPGQPLDIEIERGDKIFHVSPTPATEGQYKGKILVGMFAEVVPVSVGQAAVLSLTEPPKVVYAVVKGLARIIVGREKAVLSGPVGIVRDTAAAAKDGAHTYFRFLGALSAYLGAFNLLPFPALDGGRLIFLAFEAVSRRRADAKIEAKIHAIGLLMFLTLILVVTISEVFPKH